MENKNENEQMGLFQVKKLLGKEKIKYIIWKAIKRMGENICNYASDIRLRFKIRKNSRSTTITQKI